MGASSPIRPASCTRAARGLWRFPTRRGDTLRRCSPMRAPRITWGSSSASRSTCACGERRTPDSSPGCRVGCPSAASPWNASPGPTRSIGPWPGSPVSGSSSRSRARRRRTTGRSRRRRPTSSIRRRSRRSVLPMWPPTCSLRRAAVSSSRARSWESLPAAPACAFRSGPAATWPGDSSPRRASAAKSDRSSRLSKRNARPGRGPSRDSPRPTPPGASRPRRGSHGWKARSGAWREMSGLLDSPLHLEYGERDRGTSG